MTIRKINYGLAPDDGTGDKLRDAFRKTDDNFTDLDTRKANAQDVVDALAFKADVTYVNTELAKKANLAGPALTGTPTAPTASAATNTTQLATTAFVQAVKAADTGSAATAVALKTARTINGVSFNGTANITINAVDATSRVASSEKGAANGVATLDATGKVPAVQLPSYVDDVLEFANLAAFPATGESGKIYVALDTNKTYRWSGSAYVYITSGAGAVDSVAGKTGVVTLVKADVGLSNVDNTADSAKPVSTAQQTALNLKANLASPALTGTPTAPTAATATNTTQLATTAFVQAVKAADTGSSATALTLKTARTINGTSFNGSANITTASWGTARNIAVGSTAKSVDGSVDVSWTVAEIGAEPVLAAGTTSQYYRGDKTWQTLNKAAVGLSSVDNTADSDKPVSTAQQTALNLKANLASPAFTGTPTAPTQSAGSNTTHLATTAFVTTAVGNAVANLANHTGGQPIATVAGLPLGLPLLVKVDPSLPCLIKTSATTLAIKAGTHVKIGNAYVSLTVQTAVVMPAVMTPGEDYAVFVHPDGTASALADPFFAPAAAPVPGALKIGGFHYGLTAPGTTPASGGFATTGFTNSGGNYVWTQARVDRVAGINEFSIWDLTHRSKGEQHGFTFDPQRKVWDAIYFCSPDHITNGISRYNTPVASGTVPPKIPLGEYGGNGVMTYGRLSAYEALEILASHGCRLMTQEEFASGALGVTEGQSLGGAASTIPATKREPGYTSRIGLEQATGHICTIGGPLTSAGGGAWTAGPNRGNFYGGAGLPLFGGNRADAATSGSRTSSWNHVFWASGSHIGLRAACDHLSA